MKLYINNLQHKFDNIKLKEIYFLCNFFIKKLLKLSFNWLGIDSSISFYKIKTITTGLFLEIDPEGDIIVYLTFACLITGIAIEIINICVEYFMMDESGSEKVK
jgi:hypothetical protein